MFAWLVALLGACSTPSPPGPPQTVVLVVMDTVRADHTSLCGHDRPTTPRLDALAARRGAVHACRAYSPAPWTHPSHASLLTGAPVEEHGAVWTSEGTKVSPWMAVRPLAEEAVTLPEELAAAGYQTALVSANPVLAQDGGLLQGFEQVRVAARPLELRGERFPPVLAEVLDAVDAERPLLLVVNLYDAHDPYPGTDGSLPWGGRAPAVMLVDLNGRITSTFRGFIGGTLHPDTEEAFLLSVRDGYDAGIHAADANLGAVLDALQARGRLADARVVVTSDHGELLGEHRLLRHGGFLWEEVERVPVVAWDSRRPLPALPEPLAGRAVHALLRDGRLPDLPVTAVSDNPGNVEVGVVGGALWEGTRKGVVADGRVVVTDLARDPREIAGMEALEGDAMVAPLRALAERVEAVRAEGVPERKGLGEALRAVGYVE
ncbi:MAG: sulfatase-like hydrolase/transferase [Alphaproteobacteria bacterium]|nr:sulfatase-like hydrolase/transferase [Alphaproteobacteria bacterium]